MDTTHWPQGIGVVRAPMEGSKQPINNNDTNNILDQRRSSRPQKDQALNCPRCNSTNTKFCYYNNYSLTQPRYFCKTCRRYWTEGGSLRNVPVGGGSRKNKRSSSSTATSASISTSTSTSISSPPSLANKKLLMIHDHHHNPNNISPSLLPPSLNFPHHHQSSASQNPKLIHQGQDLNLAYPPTAHHDHDHHNMTRSISFLHHHHLDPYNSGANNGMINPNNTTSTTTTTTATTNTSTNSSSASAMELLKTGMALRPGPGLSSFMVHSNTTSGAMFSSPLIAGFPNLGGNVHHHEFKPSLSFGLDQYDHHQGGYNNNGNLHDHRVQESPSANNSARLLFPSDHQDLKQVSSATTTTDHHDDHDRSDRHQFEQINRGQGEGDNSASGYNWNGMLGGGSW